MKLLRMTSKEEALPEQHFVYGLHVSPTHTCFLAHFPVFVDDHGEWSFCQVVLAKITSTYNCANEYEDEDDIFLYRWRLCVALLTVIQHILELEKVLGILHNSTTSNQAQEITRYPTAEPAFKADLCVVDFALAARAIPATMRATVERNHLLPLTITSPAVLLGVRAKYFHNSGEYVSEDEMGTLINIMRPHLDLFSLLQRYNVIIPSYAPPINTSPTLYCTYLKKGFLHVLAFSRSGDNDTPISGHLIDSLPLSLSYNTQEDIIERMRVALALFALQRQAVRICEGWNSICWPNEVLIEEHEIIVEVTGVTTPSPSADLPPPNPETDGVWPDDSIEDTPSYIKGQIAKSKQYVSKWLSNLDQPQDDIRDSFMFL
ncbi:hypothetical protein EIP86_008423 [Pleurotus ostreatoroseus]|nr:hypothetical protein EIP86_008423 [Pleurotus ostreatoroseus]